MTIIKSKNIKNINQKVLLVDVSSKFYRVDHYQALVPLCGIFDQRAAEQLVHRADYPSCLITDGYYGQILCVL